MAFLYPLIPFIIRRKFMYCSCSWCKPSNFHGYNPSRALHLFWSLVVFSMDSNFKPNQRRVNEPTSNSLTMSTAGTFYRGRRERNKGSDMIKTGPTNLTRTLKRIKLYIYIFLYIHISYPHSPFSTTNFKASNGFKSGNCPLLC